MPMDESNQSNALGESIFSQGHQPVSVTRYRHHEISVGLDEVVEEYPVALIYNGISHAVMMVTPINLDMFAIGFSLSEGIIQHVRQIYDLDIEKSPLGYQIHITIASEAFAQLKAHRRSLIGQTGCGLCGIESLQQVDASLAKITISAPTEWLSLIPAAMISLQKRQPISAVTGGAHAAAWVCERDVLVVFEDAGRHNALDKLIGYLVKHKIPLNQGFVVMTSRASYELVKKCIQLDISLLATISAPSTLAIETAKRSGLTLASFCRNERFSVYT